MSENWRDARGENRPDTVLRVAISDADHHVMVDQPLAFVAGLRGPLAGWAL